MFQKNCFLKFFIRFYAPIAIVIVLAVNSSPSRAMEAFKEETLSLSTYTSPKLYWKKMTISKEDHRTIWELNQQILKSSKEHTQYIELGDLGDFDSFYKKNLAAQSVPAEETIFVNLNPLSGIYLFYLDNNKNDPIGFIKISGILGSGMVEESIAFKENCPKGCGAQALGILKTHIDQYCEKELCFCVEKEEDKKTSYVFETQTFYNILAGVQYPNIPSLIAHTRMGMEPLFHVKETLKDGTIKSGVYFVYPPLNHNKFKVQWPDVYKKFILPTQEITKKLKPVLKQVSEQETRSQGLKLLEELNK